MEKRRLRNYGTEDLKLIEMFMLNSFDGIFIVDKKGKLLLTNPAIERLLDAEKQELVGKQVSELIKNGIYQGSPTMESIGSKKAYTGLVKTRAGREIISTSKPILSTSGEVELIVTNCRPLKPLRDFLNSYDAGKLVYKYDAASNVNIELIHNSNIMKSVMNKADRMAKSDSAVIIYGETGSGKGLLANYIHGKSYRNQNNMVEINCAAIPENLIESELFGYEKGAFTGASTSGKLGLFEIADGGTIFLDEIGEMPLLMQAKLLKVLDAGYIMRVGGTVSHKVNARIIVATNRNLKTLVKQGKFREDLYYRLHILPIRMPPLRERKEDVALLLKHTLKNLNEKYGDKKYFSLMDSDFIEKYDWPGNVRQLKNVVERLYILSEADEISIEEELVRYDSDLYDYAENDLSVTSDKEDFDTDADGGADELKTFLKKAEQRYIQKALDSCGGNMSAAANKLGIHRTALYRKVNSDKVRFDGINTRP